MSIQLLKQLPSSSSRLHSTPFDLDLYNSNDDDEDQQADDNDDDRPPLAAPPSTKLILGINKYSHDTTLCAADADTSEVLFAISKERISRTKHDGGNIVTLVETCLDTLDLNIDNIHKVIMNNHHHRILPLEDDIDHMEWEEGLVINGGIEDGYSDEYNVLEGVDNKLELSHHLAHAYSVCAQSPFDTGLIVVMDGMGETYRAMKIALDSEDDSYVSDFTLCKGKDEKIEIVPKDLDMLVSTKSYYDWREAESVYTFCKDEKTGLKVKVRSLTLSQFPISLVHDMSEHIPLNLRVTTTYYYSPSSKDLHKRIVHQHYTIMALRIWIRWERYIHVLVLTSLEIGMLGKLMDEWSSGSSDTLNDLKLTLYCI